MTEYYFYTDANEEIDNFKIFVVRQTNYSFKDKKVYSITIPDDLSIFEIYRNFRCFGYPQPADIRPKDEFIFFYTKWTINKLKKLKN